MRSPPPVITGPPAFCGCPAGTDLTVPSNCSADPRFTLDPDNYTNVFTTGYPLCIPSTEPRDFTDTLDVTAVGKELEKRDARYLALACRIAAELGAHFVKTYYCEDFGKVVKGCPVPLVVAGGPKLETELDAFQLAHDAIQEGAVGVDMGRNIWQSEHPVPMIRAIREIVHGGATVREAQEAYNQSKKTKEPLIAKPSAAVR